MNARVEYLRRRRELLITRAADQRSEISSIALHLQQNLRPVDMGFAIVQTLRKHPVMVLVSATLLLAASKNKLLLWSSQLFTAWELFSVVRKHWRVSR